MKRFLFLAAVAILSRPVWGQDEDPDRKMPSRAILTDGLRAEGASPPDLTLALAKFRKALIRAKEEKNDDVAAGALIHMGRCEEKQTAESRRGPTRLRGGGFELSRSAPVGKPCPRKARPGRRGCLARSAALVPRSLAGHPGSDPRAPAFQEERAAIGEKILALGKQSIPGLLWGLGHADPVIRDCAAGWLAEVIDERGIATVLSDLEDPSPRLRAGAAAALRKLLLKVEGAASLERQARALDQELHLRLTPRTKGVQDELAGEVAQLRRNAAAIRKNIPAELDTPHIEAALQKIIADETAFPEERCEAAGALKRIGRISGTLVDALLKGMDSKDRNVRASCCRAGAGVDPLRIQDRVRIADRLMRAVSYEPSKDDRNVTPDWANDEIVRQAAAQALEQIGLITSVPALIRALGDNETSVRDAAFRALHRITGKDLKTKDDLTYEADQPLAERRKLQARWQEWWKETSGVGVLVERFWTFQSTCEDPLLVDLFYPCAFLKDDLTRRWMLVDPASDLNGPARLLEEIRRQKDLLVQDAVGIGPEAFDRFLAYIGGETEHRPGPNAATRAFIAESCALLIRDYDIPQGVQKIRTLLVEGGTPAKQAGAAMALGFLGKEKVSAADRELLQTRGLGSAAPEVRTAAALALALVGDPGCAADLSRAALDENESVSVAALRALAEIHPRNAATVKALGSLITDEPPSKKAQSGGLAGIIREYAAAALGTIGDPAALEALMRARQDEWATVREAASRSVGQLYELDPRGTNEVCLKVFRDQYRKFADRMGALLCLKDRRDPSLGKYVALKLIDPDPPRKVRELDPGIRVAICETLGSFREKGLNLTVVDALIRSMADEDERMTVREAAYNALTSIRGIDPEKPGSSDRDFRFYAGDPKTIRDAAIAKWQAWFAGEKGSLKDSP